MHNFELMELCHGLKSRLCCQLKPAQTPHEHVRARTFAHARTHACTDRRTQADFSRLIGEVSIVLMNRHGSVKLPAFDQRGIDRNAGGGSFTLLGGWRDRVSLLCGFALLLRRRALVVLRDRASVCRSRFALGHALRQSNLEFATCNPL